jgi:hypothetical protein
MKPCGDMDEFRQKFRKIFSRNTDQMSFDFGP